MFFSVPLFPGFLRASVVGLFLVACVPAVRAEMVLIPGGTFRHPGSNYAAKGISVSDFYLSKHEVTQQEWAQVMGTNPSSFKGDPLPVESVSWYDCIEYCNRRSEAEGLQPVYIIDRATQDPGNHNPADERKWTVTWRMGANGYRLPTEAEWEYAASGGQSSRATQYSGSNDLSVVGWFWENSGDERIGGLWNWPAVRKNHGRTHPVGSLQPNELGLHDLSGNVREWCWDWMGDIPRFAKDPRGPAEGVARVWKGGGWMGADFCCEPAFRGAHEPHSLGYDHGFRVCRDR